MATMAALGADLLKNIALREYWLVGYHPHSSLLFYFQVSIRGGHGGHGGHALRIHRDPRPVHEDTVQALRHAIRRESPVLRSDRGEVLTREESLGC